MGRNGLAAVDTKQPNELYDSLSQDGQDQWDAIGALGYMPEKGAAGMWFARKVGQTAAEAIGPTEFIGGLKSLIAALPKEPEAEIESDETEESEETSPVSSTRLPGMEEPDIEELDRLGDDCIDAKEKRDQAKTAFDDHCDHMRQRMRHHGRKRYNRRGFSLVIEDSEKLVIKKAEQAPAKNPKKSKKAAA